MPKKNQIKFRDFQYVVAHYMQQHFFGHRVVQKKGSGIRYEIFYSQADNFPNKMWVVHEEKYVHKGDLTKTCQNLGITLKEFMELVEDL